MKTWLKGGLIGIGIFLVGLISLFIDQAFFGGATTIFDYIYKSVFFTGYIFRNFTTTEGGTIMADLLGIILSPIIYFILGSGIGILIDKIKSKK